MATLTISATYGVSSDPVVVPLGGKLDIVLQNPGCVICLESDLDGKGKYELTANKTIDLKDHTTNQTIGYDVYPAFSICPARRRRNAHSIQIGSGMPG